MTQSSDPPQDPEFAQGGFSPQPGQNPYPSAPTISQPYGNAATPGIGSRWARLFAAIIDGIILNAICPVIVAPFIGYGAMYSADSGHLGKRLTSNALTAIVSLIYFILQHGRWGQTIGKRALSIRVVLADDGGPIDYGTAAWRSIFTALIALVTCGIGALVDVLWILWDPRRQALHDKVARTVVMKAEGPDPYAGR